MIRVEIKTGSAAGWRRRSCDSLGSGVEATCPTVISALDGHGQPRFEWLVRRGEQHGLVVFYVFDLLQLGDRDLRSEPLFRRKSLLQKLLRKNDTLRYVDHIPTEGLQMFGGALALGMEGIVAKDKKSQTWHWQKIKNKTYQRQEKINFHNKKN